MRSLEEATENLASEAERNAQRFYQSCLNFNVSNKEPLLDLLVQIGGWPAIQDENNLDKTRSFQENLQTVHSLRADAFFKWSVYKPNIEHEDLPPDEPFILVDVLFYTNMLKFH